MTKGEKILFVIAVILAVAAVLAGAFTTYFGVSAQIIKVAHEADGNIGTGLGLGFTLVFMLLGFIASAAATFLSVVLFMVKPVRSAQLRVRRVSRTAVAVLVVLLIVQAVFFLLGFL